MAVSLNIQQTASVTAYVINRLVDFFDTKKNQNPQYGTDDHKTSHKTISSCICCVSQDLKIAEEANEYS